MGHSGPVWALPLSRCATLKKLFAFSESQLLCKMGMIVAESR